MSILIKNVLLNNARTDIAIQGNRISRIAPDIEGDFDEAIDGTWLAALPPFYNTHTHAAMTLLQGYADDMELFDWLNNHIWPAEAKLTPEFVYWGTKLACMQMIRSGTVFFCDMYFKQPETVRAVEESGMRAAISLMALLSDPEFERDKKYGMDNRELWDNRGKYSSRIQIVWGPHAIYTVDEPVFRYIAKDAAERGIRTTIHVSETAQEVADCVKAHGCSPVAYLDALGILTDKTIAAHSVHLSDDDIKIYADCGVFPSYNACSNYKLCSGKFRFRKMVDSGVKVTLGTDGCASNNNLSMFEEMKFGALGGKLEFGGPFGATAQEMFTAATRNGAEAFGIDAGVIEEGRLADIMLVDLKSPFLAIDHNLISNLVYAADSSCVATLICDGRIIMRNRIIPGMDEVLENARRCAHEMRDKVNGK